MIRLSCFVILGPFIGYLAFVVTGGGFKSHAAEAFVLILPFALLAGLPPALIAAAADRGIELCGVRSFHRYLLTGAFGYAAAYLLMIANLFESTPMVSLEPRWGLIGAIPAIVCSWITDRIENPV